MRRTDDLETHVDRDDAGGGATNYWSGLCTWMYEPSSKRFPERIRRYRNEQGSSELALKVGDKYASRRLGPMINSTLYDLCGMYMSIDGCAYVVRKICRCRNELFFSNASYMSDTINPPPVSIDNAWGMHMGF